MEDFHNKDHSMENMMNTLKGIMKTFRSRQFREMREFSKENNLRFSSFTILHHLAHKNQMTISDLTRFMDISKAAVSQLVEKLVSAGLVFRKEDEEDRRVKVLTLSPKGEKMIRKLHSTEGSWVDELQANLTEKEIEIIDAGLTLLKAKLNALEENREGCPLC